MGKDGYNFMYRIKNNTFIRRICWPYMNFKRKRDHEQYLRTADSWYLKTLKGIHANKRCFIIGNGPSLRAEDLDKLKGEYTFAVNRIFRIFDQTDWRPTYYLSIDDRILKETGKEFLNYDLGHMFLEYHACPIKAPSNKLTRIYHRGLEFDTGPKRYNDTTSYVSVDVSNHFCPCSTVTFHSIQLAIYMGFTEIYLLGVDNNYSCTIDTSGNVHIDPSVNNYFEMTDTGSSSTGDIRPYPCPVSNTIYNYVIAKEYCDSHDIIIKNATRGGKLEVFERMTLEEILSGGMKESNNLQ